MDNIKHLTDKKYFVILFILFFIIIILGITNIAIFITKDNASTANNATTASNIETLAKQTCADLNGEFVVDGYQYYLNATNYYSCKSNEKVLFDIYVFKNSFTESMPGNTTLASAQAAGTGDSTDGATVLDVGEDYFKMYETYSNGYLFIAGFDNLEIELHANSIEQANKLLSEFGYPE